MESVKEIDYELLNHHHQSALNYVSDGDYALAKDIIDEALFIDPHSLSLIKLRADINLKLQNLSDSADDASLLVKLSPNDTQNHLLLAKVFELQGNYESALIAIVSSLEVSSCRTECMLEELKRLTKTAVPGVYAKWEDSNPTIYELLGELGVAASEKGFYNLAIKASTVALQFHHGKLGLRMRTMLTLANAHTAVSNPNLAITAYTDCFNAATDAEDLTYQIKASVSLATLYLNTDDTHMALLQYSKILDLRDKMSEEQLRIYWNPALQIALFGNMMTAYQSVGDIEKALTFGKELLIVLQSNQIADKLSPSYFCQLSDVYGICGDLCCKLKLYTDALTFYKNNFEFSKKSQDLKKKSRAYGNIGKVYAHLDNFKLSESYLVQFILNARKVKDSMLLFDAFEMHGDSMMTLGRFSLAKESYECAGKTAIDEENVRMRICALYKLGNAHRELGDVKDSLKSYQIAEMHAEESNNTDFLLRIQIGMADLLRNSNQVVHLETAGRYLHKIIPTLEGYIAENREEGRFNEDYLFTQLHQAYQGLQTVLSKTGFMNEAIEATDNLRKWSWYRYLARPHNNHHGAATKELGKGSHSVTSIISSQIARFGETRSWNISSINDLLEKQKAHVLYYSLIDDCVLIWVFHPTKGLIRQYRSSQREKLLTLIKEFYQYDAAQMLLFSEHRALPLHDLSQKLLKYRNRQRSMQSGGDSPLGDCVSSTSEHISQYLSALYDILVTPIQDIVTDLTTQDKQGEEECPQLIVVPDQELFKCPFSALIDKKGRILGDQFSISVVSSLMILSRCVNNELDHLTAIEDNEKERETYRNIGSTLDGHNLDNSPRTEPNNKKPLPSIKNIAGKNNFQSCQPRRHVNTITSETCTGTTLYKSSLQVVPYRQVADNDKMVAIGAPAMCKSLDYFGAIWKPSVKLSKAEDELRKIENLSDARIIIGPEATKETFLREAPNATILHIATWMCPDQGHLAFAPNPSRQQNLGEKEAPLPSHYLVTSEDILRLRLGTRLVLLSGGFCSVSQRPHDDEKFSGCTQQLATLFLLAGAECVLTVLWPVPVDVLNLFYFHFYQNLYSGNYVSRAVRAAQKELRSVPGYEDARYWACFQLVGKDVFIDINFVRHSHLDQTLDNVERQIWQLGSDINPIMSARAEPFNPPQIDTKISDLITQKNKLQDLVTNILKENKIYPKSMTTIYQQLEFCMIVSQNGEPQPTQVNIKNLGPNGRKLMEFLQFHFLPKGPQDDFHFVLYPSRSLILVSALEGFTALKGLINDSVVVDCLIDYLPATQDSLSFLVDLLAITKHASDLQLKVTDLSVRLLWHDPKAKKLLIKIGFIQIGLLLHFAKNEINMSYLNSMLQFCLSISSSKSPLLYQRLQVSLLGSTNQEITRHVNAVPSLSSDSKRLPGLKLQTGSAPNGHPVASDPNQIVRVRNWATAQENSVDMIEKAQLLDKKFLVSVEKSNEIALENHWEIRQLNEMKKEAETTYYKMPKYGPRVKVEPSFNPTDCPRIPIIRMPVMLSRETDKKRKETSQKLVKSLNSLKALYEEKERKLALPYLQTK